MCGCTQLDDRRLLTEAIHLPGSSKQRGIHHSDEVVSSYLHQQKMPPYTLLLGESGQGHPIFLDLLVNRWDGLVIAVGRESNRELLSTLVASSRILNFSHEVELWLFSSNPTVIAPAYVDCDQEVRLMTSLDEIRRAIEQVHARVAGSSYGSWPLLVLVWDELEGILHRIRPSEQKLLQGLWQRASVAGLRNIASVSHPNGLMDMHLFSECTAWITRMSPADWIRSGEVATHLDRVMFHSPYYTLKLREERIPFRSIGPAYHFRRNTDASWNAMV
jgi:hypothetical protein